VQELRFRERGAHSYCEITICDVLLMLIVRDGTNGTEKGKS